MSKDKTPRRSACAYFVTTAAIAEGQRASGVAFATCERVGSNGAFSALASED
jgi:hypothetical protein